MSRKHIDIKEFQALGFLQEANRLFFHPHGLALEVTIVDEKGWKGDNERVLQAAEWFKSADICAEDECVEFAIRLFNFIYPPGSVHLSGCWDYRDDPEGMIFGGDIGHDDAKAETVAKERRRHRIAREALFTAWARDQIKETGLVYVWKDAADIEPLGYVHPEHEVSE